MEDALPASHFSLIFDSFVHRGSAFIFTDDFNARKLYDEDMQLLSYVMVAVVIIKSDQSAISLIHSKVERVVSLFRDSVAIDGFREKPFVLIDLPPEISSFAAKQTHDLFKFNDYLEDVSDADDGKSIELNDVHKLGAENEGPLKIWQPTVLILFKQTSFSHRELENGTNMPIFLETTFEKFSLQLDSNIFLVMLESQSAIAKAGDEVNQTTMLDRISVWEIYEIKGRKIISLLTSEIIRLENNRKNTRFSSKISLDTYGRRRCRFFGQKLTVTVKDTSASNRDWADLRQNEEGTIILTGGYLARFYDDLKAIMNFTEDIIVGDMPSISANGTLTGRTVDLLTSGIADLALHKMSLNPPRAEALSFLFPTHNSLAYVFFKQPSPNSLRNIVLAPFTKKLWFSLIGFWVSLVTFFWIHLVLMTSLAKCLAISDVCTDMDVNFLKESWIWCIAAVCQKSFYLDPKSVSLRMNFMIGLVISIISYTAFSASFLSFLAVSNVPIKKIEDLLPSGFVFTVHEQSQPFQNLLKGILQSYNVNHAITTVSTADEVSHLFTVVPGSDWDISTDEPLVQSTKRAFLSYADMFYKMTTFQNYSSSFVCNHLSFFPLEIGTYLTKSAMQVKKNSQFRETLNYILLYLRGVGLVHRNDKEYNTKNILQCLPDEVQMKVQAADFSDVFTILMALICGIPIALVVFLLELATFKHIHVES